MFDKYTVEKILSGDKTVTRRLKRKDGKRPAIPGKLHKIKIDRTPKMFGYIVILECDIVKFGDLTMEDVLKEGFSSIEEYVNYFYSVNGIIDNDEYIWRIEFEVV